MCDHDYHLNQHDNQYNYHHHHHHHHRHYSHRSCTNKKNCRQKGGYRRPQQHIKAKGILGSLWPCSLSMEVQQQQKQQQQPRGCNLVSVPPNP